MGFKRKKLKLLKLSKEYFYKIYYSAHNNAVELLSEADILFKSKKYPRAYFLAFTALEELSKSQLTADVFTGFRDQETFWKYYKVHNKKIKDISWATLDANESYNIHFDTGEIIKVKKPKIEKRMNSLYVHVNGSNKVISPGDIIKEADAKEIIHTVRVALHQIMLMTEYYGHQIGTKGFRK